MFNKQEEMIPSNTINILKDQLKLMDSEDIEIRKKANDDLQRIFYPGSTKKRDL